MADGLIISTTRRNASILTSRDTVVVAALHSEIVGVTVGDRANYTESDGRYTLDTIAERRNCFQRSYRKKTKLLVANADRIFIVTAPSPLFNSVFIDRAIASAEAERIPVSLVVNKSDLDLSESEEWISTYSSIGYELIQTNTKEEGGLDELRARLADSSLSVVAFCGLSGVGKSSILKKLIPDSTARIGDLSSKSGQGTQTTSQAVAYRFRRSGINDLFIVDLPGIQHFGVTHIGKSGLSSCFPEFRDLANKCQYRDCLHRNEPECRVLEGLKAGAISNSRYNSYINMLEEIELEPTY